MNIGGEVPPTTAEGMSVECGKGALGHIDGADLDKRVDEN